MPKKLLSIVACAYHIANGQFAVVARKIDGGNGKLARPFIKYRARTYFVFFSSISSE